MQETRREEGESGGKVTNVWKREVEGEKPSTQRKEEGGEERLNMTVTGAEPSSPSREAARGDLNHDQ